MAGRKSVSPEAEQQSGAPPASLSYVAKRGGIKPYLMQKIRIEPRRTRRVVRPENDHRLADYIRHRHGTPVPAVFGVVAVVAKHKQRIRRYTARRDVFLP